MYMYVYIYIYTLCISISLSLYIYIYIDRYTLYTGEPERRGSRGSQFLHTFSRCMFPKVRRRCMGGGGRGPLRYASPNRI